MHSGTEIQLDTRQGRLGALGWRRAGAPRVLALHGWLDNAASFTPLAPLLHELDLVALDLPGHGHSEHRPATTHYHFIEYPFDIDAALDALDWPDCHLLGHSLGASISAVYAAAAPGRVRSLTLLDGLGPITAEANRTAERLRRSLARNRQGSGTARHFESLEEMVAARCKVSDMTAAAARLICERAARAVAEKFTWRSDAALNWVSALVMTEDQVLDLLRHVESPALVIQATRESQWFTRERLEARRNALANARHLSVKGKHHFHMDQPDTIANPVQTFILTHDQPAKESEKHE